MSPFTPPPTPSSDELLRRCGLPLTQVAPALEVFDLCRSEVIAGQFLDVSVQARGRASVETAMTVLRFKSAKYSIERPLHVGAALAGATPAQLEQLTAFGLPLGEAFQLRDDLLGVFGDPEATGKPAGDDLREGKHTVLVAHTLSALDDEQAARFSRHLGDPDVDDETVDWMRETIVASGAVDAVERDIERLVAQGLERLHDTRALLDDGRQVLVDLATYATSRTT